MGRIIYFFLHNDVCRQPCNTQAHVWIYETKVLYYHRTRFCKSYIHPVLTVLVIQQEFAWMIHTLSSSLTGIYWLLTWLCEDVVSQHVGISSEASSWGSQPPLPLPANHCCPHVTLCHPWAMPLWLVAGSYEDLGHQPKWVMNNPTENTRDYF